MDFDNKLTSAFVLNEGSARLYKMAREHLSHLPKRVFDELWDNSFWPTMFQPWIRQAKTGSLPTTGPWVSTDQPERAFPEQQDRSIMQAFKGSPAVKHLKSISWGKGGTEERPGKPEIVKVNPNDFTDETQDYFKRRNFGNTEIAIREDWRRTLLQRKIAWSAVPGINKPIIVLETDDGFELLEGWHRTMAILLIGLANSLQNEFPQLNRIAIVKAVLVSPAAAKQLLTAYVAGLIPSINRQALEKVEPYADWDFDDWDLVPLTAYVGRESRVAVET